MLITGQLRELHTENPQSPARDGGPVLGYRIGGRVYAPEDVTIVRSAHCAACREPWPCTVIRLADQLDAVMAGGDALVRAILTALCQRDGITLDGGVDGGPPRNYELALRLGIGHVFGLPYGAS